jgi:quinol monooxygenase YgiN
MSGSIGSTMDVLVAVTAFAGALLAAITTGTLIGRIRDEREGWLIAWTVATAALCLSMGAIAIGHLAGFGTVTFRIYQVTGALLAPLWLAIGVIQLLAEKIPAKFATWLVGIAFTVVACVIMISDPVGQTQDFGKTLPVGDRHWDWLPKYLLDAAHLAVLLILVIALIVSLLRWRGGDDLDADNMHALVVIAPVGIALVGSLRFAVPGVFVALLLGLGAGAVWYVVARPLAPYEDEEDEEDEGEEWQERGRRGARAGHDRVGANVEASFAQGGLEGGGAVAGRGGPGRAAGPGRPRERPPGAPPGMPPGAQGAPPVAAPMDPGSPRRTGLGDLVAEYRAGEQGEVDYAARMQPGGFNGPSNGFSGPSTGAFDGPVASGFGDPLGGGPVGPPPGGFNGPSTGGIMPVGPMSEGGMPPHLPERGMPNGVPNGMPNGMHRGVSDRDVGMPATGAVFPGAEFAAPGMNDSRPAPGIYGLLTVFTLMDGAGQAFDRLAEETIEAIRRSEPDTLIFACHAVKSAPLQRIVYELYRDEVAYADHQRQPHMERFASQRVAHVLAANVIELNVNAAKVVPLPTAFRV